MSEEQLNLFGIERPEPGLFLEHADRVFNDVQFLDKDVMLYAFWENFRELWYNDVPHGYAMLGPENRKLVRDHREYLASRLMNEFGAIEPNEVAKAEGARMLPDEERF